MAGCELADAVVCPIRNEDVAVPVHFQAGRRVKVRTGDFSSPPILKIRSLPQFATTVLPFPSTTTSHGD